MPRTEEFPGLVRAATFSPGRHYRYRLERTWGPGRTLNVIGLNPSTADAEVDDMTIGRCMRFARRWGYDRLLMTNLFALRATKWRGVLDADPNPYGPENALHLRAAADEAALVLAAWGSCPLVTTTVLRAVFSPSVLGMVPGLVRKLTALRITAGGQPGHPLYLPGNLEPQPYWPPEVPEVAHGLVTL